MIAPWDDADFVEPDGCYCSACNNPPCSYCTDHCGDCGQYLRGDAQQLCEEIDPDTDCDICREIREECEFEIERIEIMNENTKYENVYACLNEEATTLAVQFGGGSANYIYKVPVSLANKLEIGDMIVVPSGEHYKIVPVHEIHEESKIGPEDTTKYNWIVGVIDTADVDEQKEKEEKNVEHLKSIRRKQVKESFLAQNGYDKVKLIT